MPRLSSHRVASDRGASDRVIALVSRRLAPGIPKPQIQNRCESSGFTMHRRDSLAGFAREPHPVGPGTSEHGR
jgi:hypothetical protein